MPELDGESLRAEYDDSTDDFFRMAIYSEIRWMQSEYGHPDRWVGAQFKRLFGCTPPGPYKTIPPLPARKELEVMIGTGEKVEF